MSVPPISATPAWMIRSDPASTASGRSKPCVSEISPTSTSSDRPALHFLVHLVARRRDGLRLRDPRQQHGCLHFALRLVPKALLRLFPAQFEGFGIRSERL